MSTNFGPPQEQVDAQDDRSGAPSNVAGRPPSQGEPRWPATAAVLVALGLYLALPMHFKQLGPSWTFDLEQWTPPVLDLALLVALSLTAPRRHADETAWQRYAAVVLIAVVNIANVLALVVLVQALLSGGKTVTGQTLTGRDLLLPASFIWLTNIIVFALWYWELDRGGPDDRSAPRRREPDFLFPQMTTPGCTDQHWSPGFIDYLYVAFTNATAFSPTDTMPLTPWAKMLMLGQALTSFLTVALVAARAVNILSV